jgi:hypothetical protein
LAGTIIRPGNLVAGEFWMDNNQRKEQFSRAFVHAIATVAGYTIYTPEVDDDSVDLGIAARGQHATRYSPRLELQLKCTAGIELGAQTVRFPLSLKNYDDLRRECWVPRILVVVIVPKRINDWIDEADDRLVLNCRAQWVSLLGNPKSPNKRHTTVHLPWEQRFTVAALQQMMKSVNQRGQI